MNIKPIICNYNINSLDEKKLICVSHVDNYQTRYIQLKLFEGKMPFSAAGAVAKATIVTAKEKLLLGNDVACEITNDGDILVPIDSAVMSRRSGDIKIEVRLEKDGKTLVLPFPLWIRIRGSVIDTAQMCEETEGSVKELLEEANRRLSEEQGGKSAYEIAVENGFEGTEAEWLASLKGDAYTLTAADKTAIAAEAASKVNVPSKTSQLTNDSHFLTSHQSLDNYYTKAQTDALILSIRQGNIVSSVDEMVDTTQSYVLESTGHVWVYRETTETVTQSSGNLMTVNSSMLNKRISGTSTTGTSGNGCFIADPIPVDLSGIPSGGTFPIYMKNFASTMGSKSTDSNYGNSKLCLLDSNQAMIDWKYIAAVSQTNKWQCAVSGDDCVGDLMTYFTTRNIATTDTAPSDVKYLLFSPAISSSAITANDLEGLSIEFEPSTVTRTVAQWIDTGVNYSNGNEQVLVSLENQMVDLSNRVSGLENGSEAGSAAYPVYWESEIEDTVSKVKALQTQYGHCMLCFGWCSDMHVHPSGLVKEKYLGAVAAEVMNRCDIPLMLVTGDIFSNAPSWTKENTKTAYHTAWEYLKPLTAERLLLLRGNHDAWFGMSGNESYVDGLNPNELYQYLFQPQTKDTRRVFGNDGSYFYLDDMPHKTRFICLNSQWADFTRDAATNLPLYNTQKHAGFGETQLRWLCETALRVPENYRVILAMHTPPTDSLADGREYVSGEGNRDLSLLRGIIAAYCNKTTYQGTYTHSKTTLYGYEGTWADVNISCDFSNADGTLLGVFCGHSHRDQLTAEDLPVPVITITCAADSPYGESASVRAQGTKDETAMDFVCLNTTTGDIHLIRCGYGSDRTLIV